MMPNTPDGARREARFRAIRNAPPGAVMDVVRPYVAGDDWDQPHRFLAICWDGAEAWVESESFAPLAMAPEKLPKFIMKRARDAFERESAAVEAGLAPQLYAVALVVEAHVVHGLGPDAPEWERARMRRDSRERRYHEREDAVEIRSGWIADIDGRLHRLEVRSDRPESPMLEETYEPEDTERVGGPLVAHLWASAMAYAVELHGDDLPSPGREVEPGGVTPLRRGR